MSSSPTPRPPFDAAALKPYLKQKLAATLSGVTWDKDKDKFRGLMKEIGERVKERCLQIQPGKAFKYVVLTQLNENLGQGGRADLTCHWEEADVVLQEIYSNDSIICICVVFAIRAA